MDAALQQLIAAARLPFSGISETAVNASLAFIEGAKPRDEVECALVIQMACTHTAAMAVLSRLGGGHGPDRSVAAMASAASRLLRTYATQVEALRRLRNGGSQFVRVEHVHVNEGGQAVIGNVKAPTRDDFLRRGHQRLRPALPSQVRRPTSKWAPPVRVHTRMSGGSSPPLLLSCAAECSLRDNLTAGLARQYRFSSLSTRKSAVQAPLLASNREISTEPMPRTKRCRKC